MSTTTKKADGHQPVTDIHTHNTTYPLLFTFRDLVKGNDFWAGVSIEGRAVLDEDEDEGAWFYGVQPGSLAGHGETGQEAHQDFLRGYRSVLSDLADVAEDFTAFKTLANEFLSTINRPVERQWEEAVALVRAGDLKLGWLPKRNADLKRKIEIVEVELRDTRAAINNPASPLQSLAA